MLIRLFLFRLRFSSFPPLPPPPRVFSFHSPQTEEVRAFLSADPSLRHLDAVVLRTALQRIAAAAAATAAATAAALAVD